MPAADPSIPSALSAPDAGVAALAASAGSADAVARGRWIAAGTLCVVMVGALGAGFRPIIRRAFAGAAARQATAASDARAARIAAARDDPVLSAKLARLAELERAHRERNPWLYVVDEGADARGAQSAGGSGGARALQ
jgi:hypothetical protein